MSLRRRLASTYARIGRTYWSWAPSILLLAVVVFIPLGLVDSLLADVDLDALDIGSGIKVFALILALVVAYVRVKNELQIQRAREARRLAE